MSLVTAPDPSQGRPSDCTALKLRRLARRVTQIYDDALGPHGLTVGQLGILAALRRSRGVGIAALAEQLSTDASTLSRLVRPLRGAGLLSIEPDPADGRGKLIRLTDAGRDRVRAAAPAWEGAQAAVARQLGGSRLAALRFIVDDAFDRL